MANIRSKIFQELVELQTICDLIRKDSLEGKLDNEQHQKNIKGYNEAIDQKGSEYIKSLKKED